MKKLSTLVFLAIFTLIVWIDLPDNGITLSFKVGKSAKNVVFKPPKIKFVFAGRNIEKDFVVKLGLDLKGGSHMVFEADMKDIPSPERANALVGARNIIEQRVNFFGVTEPTIQTFQSGNNYRIEVDLPGTQDTEKAVSLIGQTARLEFTEEATSEAKQATNTPLLLNV